MGNTAGELSIHFCDGVTERRILDPLASGAVALKWYSEKTFLALDRSGAVYWYSEGRQLLLSGVEELQAIATDGTGWAIGGLGGEIACYNLNSSGEPTLLEITPCDEPISSIALSAQSLCVATESGAVYTFCRQTGKGLNSWDGELSPLPGILAAAYSPSGQILVVAGAGGIACWQNEKWERLDGNARELLFATNERFYACGVKAGLSCWNFLDAWVEQILLGPACRREDPMVV